MRKFPDKKDFLERALLYPLLDQKKYAEALAIAGKFTPDDLRQNHVFTGLAAVAYAYGGDVAKAKSIVNRLGKEYPICKDDKFLINNWSFRGRILAKFKELIGR